jgi:hypothetical protein
MILPPVTLAAAATTLPFVSPHLHPTLARVLAVTRPQAHTQTCTKLCARMSRLFIAGTTLKLDFDLVYADFMTKKQQT